MKLPKQTRSVDRTVNVAAQVTGSGTVAPSGFLDILGKAAKGALAGVMS